MGDVMTGNATSITISGTGYKADQRRRTAQRIQQGGRQRDKYECGCGYTCSSMHAYTLHLSRCHA
jgi:hypothetical protein